MDLWTYEREQWNQGFSTICGVDEAGAGPLAGPVYAAAVILSREVNIPGLNDSDDRLVAPFLGLGAQLFPARADMKWFATSGKEGTRPAWLSRDLPYMGAAARSRCRNDLLGRF